MNRTQSLTNYWRCQKLALSKLPSCHGLLALLALFAFAQSTNAAILSLPLGFEYSGGADPAGSAPWLTAIFDDEGTPGTVKLKLAATNLTGTEYVSEWNFNLNPSITPSDLSFSAPTKTGGNGFDDPTIGLSANTYKAGPDEDYDIEFGFATSNSGGGNKRFGVGEMAEYLITGSKTAANLVAADFIYKSDPGKPGVGGPYFTGAHVQSIATSPGSGWITAAPGFDPRGDIPEPATWMLMTLALGSLGIRRAG